MYRASLVSSNCDRSNPPCISSVAGRQSLEPLFFVAMIYLFVDSLLSIWDGAEENKKSPDKNGQGSVLHQERRPFSVLNVVASWSCKSPLVQVLTLSIPSGQEKWIMLRVGTTLSIWFEYSEFWTVSIGYNSLSLQPFYFFGLFLTSPTKLCKLQELMVHLRISMKANWEK